MTNIPKPKFKSHNVILVSEKDKVDEDKLFECYNCNSNLLIQDPKSELICHNCNSEFKIEDSDNLTKLQKLILREKEKGKTKPKISKYLQQIGFKEKDFKTTLDTIFNNRK